jgi:hypothetical protein
LHRVIGIFGGVMAKFERMLAILTMVPIEPRVISVNDLVRILEQEQGCRCTQRTIQRNVLDLELALGGLLIVSRDVKYDLDKSSRICFSRNIKKLPLFNLVKNNNE